MPPPQIPEPTVYTLTVTEHQLLLAALVDMRRQAFQRVATAADDMDYNGLTTATANLKSITELAARVSKHGQQLSTP